MSEFERRLMREGRRKPPMYRRSKQYEALRDQLNKAGCTVQANITTFFEGGAMHKLLIFRDDKPPVGVVVVDWPEDGYALYIANNDATHEKTVAAILAAD